MTHLLPPAYPDTAAGAIDCLNDLEPGAKTEHAEARKILPGLWFVTGLGSAQHDAATVRLAGHRKNQLEDSVTLRERLEWLVETAARGLR